MVVLIVPPIKGVIRLFSLDSAHRFVFRAHQWVGLFLRVAYGIKIKVIGRENIPEENGFLIVGNHIGYVELISLISVLPAVFVAKEEVKSWPLLGLVFRVGGEVFVDRDSGGRSDEYVATIVDALTQGINIFFSPEGTTSNGTILRRFKSPLFVPANHLKRQVLPFAFYPDKIENKPVTLENRDKVLWHSNRSFGPHLIKFLKLKSISTVINFGEAIVPDYEDCCVEARREFSSQMRQKVDELYRPINPFYTGGEEEEILNV